MQDTLFDYSVSLTGTEEIIFTESVFACVEYSQISFKMTEACFMLWWNKKMYLLKVAPLTRFCGNKYSGSFTKIFCL